MTSIDGDSEALNAGDGKAVSGDGLIYSLKAKIQGRPRVKGVSSGIIGEKAENGLGERL